METTRAVFTYTLKEHLRHKVWLSAALFGLALLAGGLVASALGQEERGRLMLDLGLAANEGLALVSAVFLTVHLILQEIESRAVFFRISSSRWSSSICSRSTAPWWRTTRAGGSRNTARAPDRAGDGRRARRRCGSTTPAAI